MIRIHIHCVSGKVHCLPEEFEDSDEGTSKAKQHAKAAMWSFENTAAQCETEGQANDWEPIGAVIWGRGWKRGVIMANGAER